jgi:hypothetical protein
MRHLSALLTSVMVLVVANAHAESKPTPTVAGSWAQLMVTTSIARLPVIGKVENRSYFYALVRLEQEGAELVATTEPCFVRIDGEVKRVKTIIPRPMLEVMGPRTRAAAVTPDGDVTFQRAVDVLGARLDDPWRDALPTEPDDEAVIDEDRDGNPGVTVKIVGPIDGEIYVVQRSWNELRGTLAEDGESIRGRVTWRTHQEVVGASNMFLKANPDAKPHPDPDESWFEMKRIDASQTCDDIRKNHNRLFEM